MTSRARQALGPLLSPAPFPALYPVTHMASHLSLPLHVCCSLGGYSYVPFLPSGMLSPRSLLAACFPSFRSQLQSHLLFDERPCLTIIAAETPKPILLGMCQAFNNYLPTGGPAFKSVTNCICGQKDCGSLVRNSIHHTLLVMLFSLELITRPQSVCKMRIMINISLETF